MEKENQYRQEDYENLSKEKLLKKYEMNKKSIGKRLAGGGDSDMWFGVFYK